VCISKFGHLVGILAALTLGGASLAEAASNLGAYNVNPDTVTVAGISSGGYMAVQLQIAYSSHFYGTAVIAVLITVPRTTNCFGPQPALQA
jgi:poly(3-hydroxybutyrate) depolymerase